MLSNSCIELKGWHLPVHIGSYGPGETVPHYHALDLTLWINSRHVLIGEDGMQHVFDYDPLVAQIEHLASERHYETQERLMTRIVESCAAFSLIEAVDISLKKFPVRAASGELGIRLHVDQTQLRQMRGALQCAKLA